MRTTSRSVYDELISRGIPVQYQQVGETSFFLYPYRGELHAMTGISTDLSSSTSRTICNNKDITTVLGQALGVHMPATIVYDTDEAAHRFLDEQGLIVVKPADSAHGNGVTINVATHDQLSIAMERARQFALKDRVILQQQVTGNDYRVLVIDGSAVAVSERVPASVVGDGVHTIAELIEIENATNPQRGHNYEKPLNIIDVEAVQVFLGDKMNDVPAANETVAVVGTANMGTGGKAINRTNEVPAGMKEEAERIASTINAFTCGVDFMYDPARDAYYLIELNSSPSFGLHHAPSEGEAIDVAKIFVDKLLARYDQALLTKRS